MLNASCFYLKNIMFYKYKTIQSRDLLCTINLKEYYRIIILEFPAAIRLTCIIFPGTTWPPEQVNNDNLNALMWEVLELRWRRLFHLGTNFACPCSEIELNWCETENLCQWRSLDMALFMADNARNSSTESQLPVTWWMFFWSLSPLYRICRPLIFYL